MMEENLISKRDNLLEELRRTKALLKEKHKEDELRKEINDLELQLKRPGLIKKLSDFSKERNIKDKIINAGKSLKEFFKGVQKLADNLDYSETEENKKK